MSSTPNSLPAFGVVTTVARDLSLPFRRDTDIPWQRPSNPLSFKNPQNSRTQTIFFYAIDASNTCLSDVDVETQSFSSIYETPLHQFYSQKITAAILQVLLAIKSFGRRIIRHY